MISARRLKRNLKRALLPCETLVLWIAGPMALLLYWISWNGMRLMRLIATFYSHLRF